ncbi:SdrD B-like domain-containing protein, partial [Staphylococcus epidermidis]|uniref:SdrD B-like domain-containing protein n=1 Tax=Staphylococcus epidermidis TaxID=1282 RepID=UPI002874E2B2
MKKRRQGPINKRVDFLSNKVNKYSIRKFTVGTASILVGATLMFGAADNEAKAAEDNQLESASKEEQKGSRDNENSKLNQVDLDNGSHSSEKTTNVNNATEVKKVEAPTVNEESIAETPKTSTTQQDSTEKNNPSLKDNLNSSSTTSKESKTDEHSTKQAQMSTNKSNLDTNDSPTQSEKTSSQANNDSTDNQSAPSKQLDSKPSEQKVYKTKFNDEPTQDVEHTTTKLKTPSVSTDSSVNDKQDYTRSAVASLGVDSNETEAITNAVRDNLDLKAASREQINEAIIAEALKKDFSNPDYGVDTPLALNTSQSKNSPHKSASPRMNLMSLAAEPNSGKNVNDKVKITNPTLSLNKSNNHANNVIWPTSNEQFNLKANYELDDSIKEGDTFTIKYGQYIRPGGLELPAIKTQLRSKDGSIVANGVYDKTTNTTTYTFTNYVDQYQNITGSFDLIATPKRETAIKDNQNYPMEVTIANEVVKKDFIVDYGNKKDNTTTAAVANVDNVNNKHNEVVYLNQNNQNPKYAKYFSTVKNGKFIPGEVKVYEVTDTNAMVDSFNPDLNSSNVKDVTSQFAPKVSADGTRVDINFARSMANGKKYIVTQAVRPTGTGNVYTEYWLTRDGTTNTNDFYRGTKSTTVSYLNGSSTAQGDNPTYSLGDYVWLDKNKNGVQDDDEKGLAGVYVTLKDSNNRELQRVTTDQSGHYQFDNLQNGTYTVEFAIPDNYTPSPANNSTNDAIDSDGERDGTRKVVVAKGTINNADNMTVDTGFYLTPKYNVGDYVWEDTNKDSIQDDNEKGISGVKVTLKNKNGDTIGTTTTDSNGKYEFTGLENGDYTIEFETPEGYTPTKQNSGSDEGKDSNGTKTTVTVKDADNKTIDSGFYKPTYNLGDYVWEDTNKDGIQDDNEKGISGVKVTLKNKNGDTIGTTTTDSNGKYEFTGLENGDYTIEFETPEGYTPTKQNSGSDEGKDSNGTKTTVTVKDADNKTIDSGFYKPTYNLGDYVWEDTNKDGIQDDSEKGISGVKVTLKDKNGNAIGTTTTDASGHYQFKGLENGSYTVEFETPSGYTPTKANSGQDITVDSNGITTTGVINGADNLTIDSGFYKTPKYSVGDYVWEDTNKDGIQDDNEKGISNVKVTLKNKNGDTIGTTTTDSNGKYEFTGLENGDYTIEFETPEGYTSTKQNSGSDEGKDSNGTKTTVTVKDADNKTIDSGFYKPTYNLGDYVWEDTNKDGIQDDSEKGISGVKVTLKDKNGNAIGTTTTDASGHYQFKGLE